MLYFAHTPYTHVWSDINPPTPIYLALASTPLFAPDNNNINSDNCSHVDVTPVSSHGSSPSRSIRFSRRIVSSKASSAAQACKRLLSRGIIKFVMGNSINTHNNNTQSHTHSQSLTVSDISRTHSHPDDIDIEQEHLVASTVSSPPATFNTADTSLDRQFLQSQHYNQHEYQYNTQQNQHPESRRHLLSTLPHPTPTPITTATTTETGIAPLPTSEPRSSEPTSREPLLFSSVPSSHEPKSMEDDITPENSNSNNNTLQPTVLPRYDDKNSPILDDRVAVLVAAPLSNTRTEDSYSHSHSRDDDATIGEDERMATGRVDTATDPPTITLTPPTRRDNRNNNSNVPISFGYSPHSARRVAEALSSLVFSSPPASSTSAASFRHTPSNYLKHKSDANHTAQIIPLVVRSLAEFRKDSEVVHAAILTLTQLLSKNTPHGIHLLRSKVAACGGIEAIVDVMRIHSIHSIIQSQACLLIATLAHQSPRIKLRALNAGAMLVIIAGMTIHPGVEQVQALGCYALRNVTKVDTSLVNDPHTAAAAVEVIANAMEKLPASKTVQVQAMCALTNIAALSDVAKARIGNIAVINSIILALERNIDNPNHTDVALSCLSVLVTDIDNQAKAVDFGIIEAISMALARYANNYTVVSKAASCIRFLTYEINTRHLIGQGHIIYHLIDALNLHLYYNSPGISIREMMHAIGNSVAGIPTNKIIANGAVLGAVEVIRKYVGTGPSGILLIEDACRLLYALLTDCPTNQEGAAESGLLSAVLEALRQHACESARIAEHGTAVFAVLAYNTEMLPQIQRGASDLASILRRARNCHKDNRMVARQILSLINGLGIAEEDMALAWPSGLGDPWAPRSSKRADIMNRLRCRSSNYSQCGSSGCI